MLHYWSEMLILIQGKDDKLLSTLQSDLSVLPSFVVHKRALHPGATLMPTGMNNQFSTRSIPDPNTNSSSVGVNNQVSPTSNLDPICSITRVTGEQKMIRIKNQAPGTGIEDERIIDVGARGKVYCFMRHILLKCGTI